jgi:hypothetical protein
MFMKRKITAFLLALAMALTLLPATTLAAGNPAVTLNKSDYYPGELMKFAVTNAAADSGMAYVYTADGASTNSSKKLEDFSGTKQLRLPEEPGGYELRVVNGQSRGDPVLCTAPFTVTKPPYRTDGKVTVEVLELDNGQGYPEFFVNGPEEFDGCAGMIMLKTAAINDTGYGYGTFRFGIVKTAWDNKPERPEDYELRIYTEVNSQTRKLLARQPLVFAPWSAASSWATGELKKANEAGLIPDILKGADLTKPITREEFAELAVLLYEKTMGQKATAASPNPFKDTTNPQILKAFKLGITTGTTPTTFAPKELINREQVATMLSRALRVIAPNADFSTTGAPVFADRKDISTYAADHVLFMAKLEIIKGVDGKFMPKATTTAQKASGYATATREQSIAMSVRSYEKMDTIKSSKGAAAPVKPTEPSLPVTESGSVVGKWGHGMTGALYNISKGSFDFGVYGTELEYDFKSDGTFTQVIKTGAGSVTSITGSYTVSGDILALTYKESKVSSDFGKTWTAGNARSPASYYYELGTDSDSSYLMIGLEGATPPLDTETNAVQYWFRE